MKKIVWLLSLILCVATFFVCSPAQAESAPITIKNQPIYIAQAIPTETKVEVEEEGEIWKVDSSDFIAQGGSVYHGYAGEYKDLWTLLEGKGRRKFVSHVYFDESYINPPTVIVSLAGFDVGQARNKRLKVKAKNITTEGFDIVLKTWGKSKIYSLWANWSAFGS